MSFDLIIKNGTVILENEARVVDIAVKRWYHHHDRNAAQPAACNG